jgi:putative peptidoglycan lipid II flippase
MGQAIGRATMVIIAVGLLDKLLALAREMLTAARFGAAQDLDAFNIAYAFPGIVNLLFNGACLAAFVPLYAAWREKLSQDQCRDNTLTIVYGAGLFFICLAGLAQLGTPWILRLTGYGFNAQTQDLAVGLQRSLSWLICLEGLGVVLTALLQSWKKFGQVSLAQGLINAGIIVFLATGQSLGIEALVYGFLAGTALKVAATYFFALRGSLRPLGRFSPNPAAFKEFALMTLPLLGSALIANSNILIDQSMATVLPTGAVAVLRYAYRVNDLPLQLIVLAVSRAIFPFISEQAVLGDAAGMRRIFRQSLVFVALVSLPIIGYVLIFADDIVAVLLRRGAFDALAAQQTALTLRCYSLGLFFQAYAFINGAFFSALRQPYVLLRLGVLSLFLNFSFNWLFVRALGGVHGIALSTTVTMGIISGIFLFILKDLLGKDSMAGLGKSLAALALASFLACGACLGLRQVLPLDGLNRYAAFAAYSLAFAAVYFAGILIFRTKETTGMLKLCLPERARKLLADRAGKHQP